MVAITVHVVGCVEVSVMDETLHPVPVTDNVSAPEPDPPEVTTVMGVPAVPVLEPLAMRYVA